MSQFGMQMPGGAVQRGASMNVYTGLLFLAMVALLAASVFVFLQARKVSPDGQVFKLHEAEGAGGGYRIQLPAQANDPQAIQGGGGR
jgi:hypothetical protein